MGRQGAVDDAEAQLRLARVWGERGRAARAVACYDEALACRPGYAEAFDELVGVLAQAEDWEGVELRCARWIEHHPDHASHARSDGVHNIRIDSLTRLGGIDAASERYGLTHVSGQLPEGDDTSPIMFVVERNERDRLPYLLDHHRRLGVGGFVVVDNDSDDGSATYLASQPDVVLWAASASYRAANCGAAWWDLMLRRYGVGRWCLLVDADELFVYPDSEHVGIVELCASLDAEGASAMRSLMLDFYSDRPLAETRYQPGTPFVEACPFFDHTPAHEIHPFDGPRFNITNYGGGMRARVFGGGHGGYLMNKMCLFRYRPGEVLYSGTHWLDRSTREIAMPTGALLHFKYFSSFAERAVVEVDRREHANEGAVYRQYADVVERDPELVLHDPLHSVRYEGTAQLVELGLLATGESPLRIGRRGDAPVVAPAEPRCRSSVVIIADATAGQTRTAVDAARGRVGDDAEITVLVPRAISTESIDDLPAPVVVHRCTRHLGRVELLSHAVEIASGAWVQVQHARHLAADPWSVLEGQTDDVDVVVIGDADRVEDLPFRLTAASFAVRREAYVDRGGFRPAAGSAAPWEMIQRLAASGAVVHVARAAVGAADSVTAAPHDRIAHTLLAIDALASLPDVDHRIKERWRERCIDEAADLMSEALEHGAFPMALAIAADALRSGASAARHGEFIRRLTSTVR